MATALVHIALLLYAGAAVAFLAWLVRASQRWVSLGRALLAGGLLLHLASFVVALLAMGSSRSTAGLAGAGFGSDAWRGGQLFSLLAAATVAGYLALDLKYRLPVAGAFVAPITVAVMVPAHLVNSKAHAINPELTHSVALALHVGSAALGTAALALAFGLSLVYLASEKQLKQKQPGRLFARLPSLELIDRLGWQLSIWGFVLLSVVVVTGSFVTRAEGQGLFRLEAKSGFALLAWALLAALIQARLVAGWRGRRVAILVVVGFLLLVCSYAGLLARSPIGIGRPAAALESARPPPQAEG